MAVDKTQEFARLLPCLCPEATTSDALPHYHQGV